jgi:putative peptide zinc metalloprotease protein
MNTPLDLRIQELGNLRLTLREDLVVSPNAAAGNDTYAIEDPVTSKFYYVGLREYTFLSLLDGKRTVGEALQLSATRATLGALTEREAAMLCRWLVDKQLVRTVGRAHDVLDEVAATRRNEPPGRGLHNPLVWKLPLCNPDTWLVPLDRHFGWLFGRVAGICWLAVVASGVYQVALHADRLPQAAAGVLASDNWLWLGICWIALKVVHELSHGIVCKRQGGNVREAGLLLILFAPVAYVDITSAWRFRSKWQRIHTAVAGMYSELFVAAAAAWLWSRAEAGPLQHIAFNVMLMASVTTIAFNANPLMRFDGYYVLADWLEIPNLAWHASSLWRASICRFLFGYSPPQASVPPGRHGLIRLYGLLSIAWRGVVSVSLVMAASVMFRGAGIVLAAAAVALWWLAPLAATARAIRAAQGRRANWLRFTMVSTALVAVVLSLFTVVPWFGPNRAPAVVEFAPLEVVRAKSSGFVSQLPVRPGDHVRAGDLLATLENPQLETQLRELELNIERCELKARMLKTEGKLAESQAEREQVAAFELQRAEKAAEVHALTMRASQDGIVMGRRLLMLPGTYLARGDELLAIGREPDKELRISVAQQDVQPFGSRVGSEVDIFLEDGRRFSGRLDRLEPQASTRPPHEALGANHGGPIPVAQRRERGDGTSDQLVHEFVTPRFTGNVPLAPAAASELLAGQLGQVSFRTYHESFGEHLVRLLHRWFQARLESLTRNS